MARIRQNLVIGTFGMQVPLPTYAEVQNSYQGDAAVVSAGGIRIGVPIGDPRLAGVTVAVDIPDDEVNPDGSLNKARIKAKYPDHFLTKQGRFD